MLCFDHCRDGLGFHMCRYGDVGLFTAAAGGGWWQVALGLMAIVVVD